MLTFLLQGLVLGGTAAVQPGPFQALLVSLAIESGWRRAVPAAFAPLLSDGPILILVLVVLTQLPVWLVSGLQIFGGLFLIYLAWGAYQAVHSEALMPDAAGKPAQAGIIKAAGTNFLNPNPYIFWATVAGPILVSAWQESVWDALGFLFGFYTAMIGGMIIFIMIISAVGEIGPRVNQALGWISALALLAFGLFQLARGFGILG